MEELLDNLDLSSKVQFAIFMDVAKYLDLGNMLLAPMFNLKIELENLEANGEAIDGVKVVAIDEANSLNPEELEQEPMVQITFGMAKVCFDGLRTFLQWQEYNTHALNIKLKKMQAIFHKECLESKFFSNIEKYFHFEV